MHAVTQVGVAELGLLSGGLHLHAQVDVALADLEKIDAFAQLARETLAPRALDVDFGGVFDQRLGFQAAHAARKENEQRRAEKP